jgi:hypothetical protein
MVATLVYKVGVKCTCWGGGGGRRREPLGQVSVAENKALATCNSTKARLCGDEWNY